MALATTPPMAPREAVRPAPLPSRRRQLVARAALLAAGAAVAFLVARDGSAQWQVVRLGAVLALVWSLDRMLAAGQHARRRATAFAVGCVALAVGVGIGGPHLAKAGLQAVTVAGLVALVAGLVLLGISGTELVRAARRWYRVLVVPGLLVAVLVTLLTLGQAVAATNVPRTAVGSTTPGDRGLTYLDVELETTDGVTLSGWYVPSTNGAAVVVLHGAGSTRSGALDQAVVLAGHGYGVLLFDARGHGRSEGRAMDFGWYGDADVTAAVTFLAAQPDVDPDRIAALGLSMGGEEAIGAAAAEPRLRAVVAEGATNRTAGDKGWLSDVHGWRGVVQERIEWLTYGATDLLTAADPPITLHDAVAAAAPRPVLLIAAEEVAAEADAGRYIQSASPDTVQLWVVPDTGHTAGLDTHPEQWEQRVTAFLDDALAVDGG